MKEDEHDTGVVGRGCVKNKSIVYKMKCAIQKKEKKNNNNNNNTGKWQ